MYKVLEVREYDEISKGSIDNRTCGGSLNLEKKHIIIAICINEETGKRSRITFEPGYSYWILGEIHYGGYAGDYDLLVAGDRFEIEKASAYPIVRIIN